MWVLGFILKVLSGIAVLPWFGEVLPRTAASPLSFQSLHGKVGPSCSCWRFVPSPSSSFGSNKKNTRTHFLSGLNLRGMSSRLSLLWLSSAGERERVSRCQQGREAASVRLRAGSSPGEENQLPPARCLLNNDKVKTLFILLKIRSFVEV